MPAPAEVHRYAALDGLRAAAAVAVVVTHVAFWTGNYTGDAVGRVLARGDFSVAVFFVLSGFVLSLPMFRAAAQGRPLPAVLDYLRRRAVRILPAYWISVAVALLFLPGNRLAGADDWAVLLGLGQLYTADWAYDGLVHTWSLCTEVAFYLVLPLLVQQLVALNGSRWRPGRVLACLGVLGLAGFWWIGWLAGDTTVQGPLNLWLPGFLPWFGAGMALAVLVVSPGTGRLVRELTASPSTCWVGAAVLFWIACTPLAGPLSLERPTVGEALTKHLLYLGIAVLLVAPLVLGPAGSGGPVRAVLESRPALWLGEVTYGLFLFHMIVLLGIYEVTSWTPFGGGMVPVLAVTLIGGTLLAVASYHLVERPLMLRARRRAAAPPPAPEPVAGPAPGPVSR